MKNNMENVPNEIFDWINSISFDDLHEDRKKKVLKHFTKEEYHELFESNKNIQNALHQRKHHSGKENLLRLFDEKHPAKKGFLVWKNEVLWKAASVLLLLSTLWFSLRNLKEKTITDTRIVVKYDTVYVEKESIATKSKEDSATVEKIARRSPQMQAAKKHTVNKITQANSTANTAEVAYTVTPKPDRDFQILSLSSMNNISNATKRNSMHDDSLEKNFKFVSL
jgi:hypothetical protein